MKRFLIGLFVGAFALVAVAGTTRIVEIAVPKAVVWVDQSDNAVAPQLPGGLFLDENNRVWRLMEVGSNTPLLVETVVAAIWYTGAGCTGTAYVLMDVGVFPGQVVLVNGDYLSLPNTAYTSVTVNSRNDGVSCVNYTVSSGYQMYLYASMVDAGDPPTLSGGPWRLEYR